MLRVGLPLGCPHANHACVFWHRHTQTQALPTPGFSPSYHIHRDAPESCHTESTQRPASFFSYWIMCSMGDPETNQSRGLESGPRAPLTLEPLRGLWLHRPWGCTHLPKRWLLLRLVPATSSCGCTEGLSGCPATASTESEGSRPSQTPSPCDAQSRQTWLLSHQISADRNQGTTHQSCSHPLSCPFTRALGQQAEP